jgi:hypothetical protein
MQDLTFLNVVLNLWHVGDNLLMVSLQISSNWLSHEVRKHFLYVPMGGELPFVAMRHTVSDCNKAAIRSAMNELKTCGTGPHE